MALKIIPKRYINNIIYQIHQPTLQIKFKHNITQNVTLKIPPKTLYTQC